MTAASSDQSRSRRKRYVRDGASSALPGPLSVRLLRYVAEYRIVSLPQLARLACPSQKSARRHTRVLFDAGLVNVTPIPRAALAQPADGNDADLLFGSAPNIYTITRAGARLLLDAGLIDEVKPPPEYGPRNSLFVAHELAIRDVRVWLDLCARQDPGHRLDRWCDGSEAEIDLNQSKPPKAIRPDAWFVYRLGERLLVGLVEVDRGTERGTRRWKEKLIAYEALSTSGRLRDVTGYANARVLVITPTKHRRDALSAFIAGHAPDARARFWLAERDVLYQPCISAAAWVQAGSAVLRPLIPPQPITDHASAGSSA